MKSLLRSSILALVVFAGIAAFSVENHMIAGTTGSTPQCGTKPAVHGFCVN